MHQVNPNYLTCAITRPERIYTRQPYMWPEGVSVTGCPPPPERSTRPLATSIGISPTPPRQVLGSCPRSDAGLPGIVDRAAASISSEKVVESNLTNSNGRGALPGHSSTARIANIGSKETILARLSLVHRPMGHLTWTSGARPPNRL